MTNTSVLTPIINKNQYRYPYILLGLYLTCLLATVCLANKLTSVGNLLEPGGVFVFVFTFCICDIVGEVYGYAYPRLFIWIGVLAEFIFSFVVVCVSHMPSPTYFIHSQSYQVVFDPTIRYVISALVSLLIGEFANVYLLAKWKISCNGRFFIARSFLATAFGQACLTLIVDILNYTGKMSSSELIKLMASGYAWKMCFALILAFPAWLLVKYLKKVENIDYYDINTNFNPFIFSLKHDESRSTVSADSYAIKGSSL